MAEWRGGLIVGGVLMVWLLLSGVVEQSQGAVSCGTVTQEVLPCLDYVMAGSKPPPKTSSCCAGVRALDSLASVSVENRRDICNCLENAAKLYNPDPAAVAALPGACGSTRSFSLSQNCNTLP